MEKKQLILTEEKILEIEKKNCKIQSFIRLWIIENHPENKSILVDEDTDLLVGGFLNTNFTVNKKGKELLEIVAEKTLPKKSENFDYLHKLLQQELMTLTKKKQKMLNGKYAFLQNSIDFNTKLTKIIKKYNIQDVKKVEKVLLNYVYKCYKANFEYCQTVEYYLEKNNTSKFFSDYENFEEKEVKVEVSVDKKATFDL